MKTIMSVILSAVFLAPVVQAEDHPQFYVGGMFGVTEYNDDGIFNQQRLDNDEFSSKIFAGYQFSEFVAVEAGLVSLGNYEAESLNSDIDSDFGALTVSVVGRLPLGSGLALYGQAGVGLVTVSQDVIFSNGNGLLIIDDDEDDGSGTIMYGAGLSFRPPMLKEMEVRLGWERYDFSVDVIAAGSNTLIKDDPNQDIEVIHLGAAYFF